MRLVFRARSLRRPAAVLGVAALLWAGLSPGGWQGDAHAADRSANPGTAVAWGNSDSGQLGDGSTAEFATTPVGVCGSAACPKPLENVISVDGGTFHSVALRSDGTVWTWGSNQEGQLGDGTNTDRTTPVQVSLTSVTAVAAGDFHNLALRSDGTVWAWGSNGSGQLGDGNVATASNTPVQVCAVGQGPGCTSFLSGVTAIAAGADHSLALHTYGGVTGWGNNAFGQLGIGNTDNPQPSPVFTQVSTDARAIAAGTHYSLALTRFATVLSWGRNNVGQLGDATNTDSSVPVQVCAVGSTFPCSGVLGGVTAIDTGQWHSLAVVGGGGVRSWGWNSLGQLGDGSTQDRNAPVQVCASGTSGGCTSFLGGAAAVSGGGSHSLTRQSDGTARSWGSNSDGELGDATTTVRTTPVRVCASGQAVPCTRLLDGVGAVAAGGFHSLAVTNPRADVSIAISGPTSATTDQNLTYTVTVRNDGPATAYDVVFKDTLPVNGDFVSATPTRGSCKTPPAGAADSVVTCNLGALGVGSQAPTSIVITVRAASGGTVTSTATVTSSTPDPDTADNTATIQTRVS